MPEKRTMRITFTAVILLLLSQGTRAQMSLSTAVDLALRNSPKVKMAQADLDKAKASLAESKAAFIPAVITSGGIGKSAGVPLSLPVIFTISAQSLAFNFSQPDYIRAAHSGVYAAEFALDAARSEVVEDAVTTYVSLDNAHQRQGALLEASAIAGKLQQISEDRFDAGADPKIDVTKTRRSVMQLKLQALVTENEAEALADHLRRLTGTGSGIILATSHTSIPDSLYVPGASLQFAPLSADSSMRAALANADAKRYVAHGDARYRFRPQFAFGAGYSRISTVGTNYSDYYPRFADFNPVTGSTYYNSFNSLNIGIQISVPLLDYIHRAKAHASAADAAHARFEAEAAQTQFGEGRVKLQHAQKELALRSEIARLDRDLAQDELDAVVVQLQPGAAASGGPALNPKDEQNARLQERERYLDYLSADLQLRQTEVTLMRQQGLLAEWLRKAIVNPPTGTATPAVIPEVGASPSVPGVNIQHP